MPPAYWDFIFFSQNCRRPSVKHRPHRCDSGLRGRLQGFPAQAYPRQLKLILSSDLRELPREQTPDHHPLRNQRRHPPVDHLLRLLRFRGSAERKTRSFDFCRKKSQD